MLTRGPPLGTLLCALLGAAAGCSPAAAAAAAAAGASPGAAQGCRGRPSSVQRIKKDTCAQFGVGGLLYIKGSCNATEMYAWAYSTQINPMASSCREQAGREAVHVAFPVGKCFKAPGAAWESVACKGGEIVVSLWEPPKLEPPPKPRRLRCQTRGADGGQRSANSEEAVIVAFEANASAVDVVSFEVSLTSDPRRRPFLHFTAALDRQTSAPWRAAIPGLKPRERYAIKARSHLRGQSEGDPNAWSNLTEQDLECTASERARAQDGADLLSLPASGGPKTRWIEVFRQNTNGPLPDFLDGHNSADFVGQFSTYGAMSAALQRPITRYCVEILDVTLQGVMTTTTTGEAVSAPFADYGSCQGGDCLCMLIPDRLIARQPRSQISASCPVIDQTGMCECSKTSIAATQNYTGMTIVPLPFHCGFGKASLPEGYPWPFDPEVGGRWFSHPSGGRCPPGAKVGEGGCTWQPAPLSHSVYTDDLIAEGLNTTIHQRETLIDIDLAVSAQNVDIGRRAFAALDLPACGPRAPSVDLAARGGVGGASLRAGEYEAEAILI